MLRVRTGPFIGLIAQIVVLAMLAGTVGLGRYGWAAGMAYGLIVCGCLARGLDVAGRTRLSPADRVTLTRAVLVGGVTALVANSLNQATPLAALVGLTVVALALDAVDGRVARRTETASSLGARFDMEIDAFLIFMLSVYVARSAGAWVLAIGAARYAFVAIGWMLPWMRRSLPPRFWRKVVAAVQGVVLAVATSNVLPHWLTITALAGSLALLTESFGRDLGWLWRRRTAFPVQATDARLPSRRVPTVQVAQLHINDQPVSDLDAAS